MSFRTRLLVVQATALVITIASAVVAIVALEVTTHSADRVTAKLVRNVALAEELRLDGERLVATSRGYLLSGEESYHSRSRGLEAQLDATLDRIVHLSADDVSPIERAAHAYVEMVRTANAQRAVADDPHAVLEIFDRELRSKRDTFERDVDDFVQLEQARFEAGRQHLRSLARGAQGVLVVTSALAVALSIGIGVFAGRALTRHVQRAEAATTAAQSVVAAREELMAVVSHDLRSPLQAIVLNASLLGGGDQRRIDAIERAASMMRALVDDLLDTARITSGEIDLHRERCDADGLLTEVVEMHASSARERGIELSVVPASSLALDVDRRRIFQILSNLIGNALRFVAPGGRVTVSAIGDDKEVQFDVSDTGSGIPADQLAHVFERYYRADRQEDQEGLGLGLYICRRLVEAHRGRIGVESVVGTGTTFWFTLPIGPAYLT